MLRFIIRLVLGLSLLLRLAEGPAVAGPLVQLNEATEVQNILESALYVLGRDTADTLEQVKNLPADSWQPVVKDSFGYAKTSVWLKVDVLHASPIKRQWILNFGYPALDLVELWKSTGDGFKHLKFTRHEGQSDSVLEGWGLAVPLELAPQERATFFIRIQTESVMQASASLFSPLAYGRATTRQAAGYCFYYGLVISLAIYNALIYLFVRDRSYLYYALYVTSYLLFLSVFQGLPNYIWGRESMLANKRITVFGQAMAGFWFLMFTHSFLKLSHYSQRMHKLIMGFKVYSFLIVAISPFAPYRMVSFLCLGIAASSASTPIFASYCYAKGYRPARYFVLAFGIFFGGLITLILQTSGLIPTNFITVNSVAICSAIEILLLALALGDKIKTEQQKYQADVVGLNRELKRLNSSLESQVEQQTAEIRSILQNIHQGIFLLNKKGEIQKGVSDYMKSLLKVDDLVGLNGFKLLFERSSLTVDEMSRIHSILEAVIGEDMLSFELNSHLLPHELIYQDDERELILQIDWDAVMRSGSSQIDNVLVCIRDVTRLKKLEADAQTRSQLLQRIQHLIEIRKDEFKSFLQHWEEFAATWSRVAQNPGLLDSEMIKSLFIAIHTLKGLARNYNMPDVASAFHGIEDVFSRARQQMPPKLEASLQGQIQEARLIIDAYREIARHTLGWILERSIIEIPYDKLDELLALSKTARDEPAFLKKMREFLLGCATRSDVDVFGQAFSAVPRLARDLQKPEPEIIFESAALHLNQRAEAAIRQALVHLLRNSIDHGLETESERLARRKPVHGRIHVTLQKRADGLIVLYSDDGRGLNLDLIREKALRFGLIASQDEDVTTLANVVFHPGFSTADKITEISGRGVGMDAVRDRLEAIGGYARIVVGAMDRRHASFSIEMFIPDAGLFAHESQPGVRPAQAG